LLAISTFKSPDKQAYYYNVSAKWVKALLKQPDITSMETDVLPSWDTPEEKRPFFMRVVQPFKNEPWDELNRISQPWVNAEPKSAEAYYYAGIAEGEGSLSKAKQYFAQALSFPPEHPAATAGLGCAEEIRFTCSSDFQ
jgi:hypothetical protein